MFAWLFLVSSLSLRFIHVTASVSPDSFTAPPIFIPLTPLSLSLTLTFHPLASVFSSPITFLNHSFTYPLLPLRNFFISPFLSTSFSHRYFSPFTSPLHAYPFSYTFSFYLLSPLQNSLMHCFFIPSLVLALLSLLISLTLYLPFLSQSHFAPPFFIFHLNTSSFLTPFYFFTK